MKRPISALVIAFVTAGIWGQTAPDWRVVSYPLTTTAPLSSADLQIPPDDQPVGIELYDDSVLTILIRSGTTEPSGWKIQGYADWNNLESDIQTEIDRGFMPADISRGSDELYVLWVESRDSIDSWRLHAAPHGETEVRRTVAHYESQGFVLNGLSVRDSLAWYLFVRSSGIESRNTVLTVDRASVGGLAEQARQAEYTGWMPQSVAVAGDYAYLVCVK